MNPVHIFPLYFPKTHFNIILTPTPKSSEWSLRLRFFNQNVVFITFYSAYNKCKWYQLRYVKSQITWTIIVFILEYSFPPSFNNLADYWNRYFELHTCSLGTPHIHHFFILLIRTTSDVGALCMLLVLYPLYVCGQNSFCFMLGLAETFKMEGGNSDDNSCHLSDT
jgi:hypothetical protein